MQQYVVEQVLGAGVGDTFRRHRKEKRGGRGQVLVNS